MGKLEGVRQFAKRSRIRKDNITMDLQEFECVGMHWIDLAQDRSRWPAVVSAVMKFPVP